MLGDRGVDLALATGVVDAAGARHRRVRLRPLTGRHEGWVEEGSGAQARRDVVAGLPDVVDRLGAYAGGDLTPALLGALTRGDRYRVLLALRASLDGDEVRLSCRCPNPDCPEIAEITLSVAALLGPDRPTPSPAVARVATDDGDVLVHLPRGVDDDASADAAGTGDTDAGGAAAEAWARLVERVAGPGSAAAPMLPADWFELSPASQVAIAEALAVLLEESGPETAVVARCPRCAAWIELDPDPADLLVAALRTGGDRLAAEVHALAFHYGWGEGAILDLPRVRRHRYLDLLGRELEGRPLVGSAGWLP